MKTYNAVLGMDLITWSLCTLCQEFPDEPFKCPVNSTDVKQISQIHTNTANLLKQFQTAKKLPKNFYSSLQAFLSSSSNPGKVFNNKKAKWHLSCKAHITKMNLLKMVSCKRKNATETVPVEPKKTR